MALPWLCHPVLFMHSKSSQNKTNLDVHGPQAGPSVGEQHRDVLFLSQIFTQPQNLKLKNKKLKATVLQGVTEMLRPDFGLLYWHVTSMQ